MTPDQVDLLMHLVGSLGSMAICGGVLGGVLTVAALRLVDLLFEVICEVMGSRKYREYRAARQRGV